MGVRRGVAFAAALLSVAATVRAHEHHMDEIEEGKYVSDDPIVRQPSPLETETELSLTASPGLNTMDTHNGAGVCVGYIVPYWNGPWRKYQLFFMEIRDTDLVER